MREHGVEAIIHFAASIVVPDSVRDPLGYYRNNTANSRALIECAVTCGVRHFIFSSTAAVYGNPAAIPVAEDAPTLPISPYGWSKLMTEIMLRDASRAHDLAHVILRYFNVAGADPRGRTGQSSANSTHLIKVAAEAALGLRPKLDVFGTDYPTPDGTCIRDYIHVSDLTRAHADALRHLRAGGASLTLNCGYGHGFSVLEVIETVKRVSGVDFKVEYAPRREGDPARIVAGSERIRADARLAAAVRRSLDHRRARARLGARTHNAPLDQSIAVGRWPHRRNTGRAGRRPPRLSAAGSLLSSRGRLVLAGETLEVGENRSNQLCRRGSWAASVAANSLRR